MTDEELLGHLGEHYPALYRVATYKGIPEEDIFADLRRLMADQWNEAAEIVRLDLLKHEQDHGCHLSKPPCDWGAALHMLATYLRGRALQQSREREQPDE